MTPPDSGEREVLADKLRAMHSHEGYCPHCDPKHDRSQCWLCDPHTELVSLPLSLAQRILAALESHPDLAAELRAVMPKGTQ